MNNSMQTTQPITRRSFIGMVLAIPFAFAGIAAFGPDDALAASKPGKASIIKWAPLGGSVVRLRVGKLARVTGYQAAFYTNTACNKRVKVVSAKGPLIDVKGLGYGRFYCARVRAFRKVGSKRVYGAWSAKVIVRTACVVDVDCVDTQDNLYETGNIAAGTYIRRYLSCTRGPKVHKVFSFEEYEGAISVMILKDNLPDLNYIVTERGSVYRAIVVTESERGWTKSYIKRGKRLIK